MHLIIHEKARAMAKKYSELHGVMEILREVFKLPRRNKKIFIFILLSTIISYFLEILLFTIILLLSHLTDSSMMNAFQLTSMDPKSPEYLKQVFKVTEYTMLLGLGFILPLTVVTLFFMVATIYVSAMSYLGRDLTVKDLYSKIKKIWTRPVVTWCYMSLLSSGYFFLILPPLVLVVLARGSIVVVVVGIVLILLHVFVGMYLALVLKLGFVISVLEDCYGLQALGKAEELVKGRKVVGFVLTFSSMILGGTICFVPMINKNHQTVAIQLLISFVTLGLSILVNMLNTMVSTVFYFECKQSHGEQGDVEEDIMGYRRVLLAIPLDDSALP